MRLISEPRCFACELHHETLPVGLPAIPRKILRFLDSDDSASLAKMETNESARVGARGVERVLNVPPPLLHARLIRSPSRPSPAAKPVAARPPRIRLSHRRDRAARSSDGGVSHPGAHGLSRKRLPRTPLDFSGAMLLYVGATRPRRATGTKRATDEIKRAKAQRARAHPCSQVSLPRRSAYRRD
jgi:hypothetical protein